ncbi:immunoglobulin-like domain-containing protein, partial [Enterococcus faecium]
TTLKNLNMPKLEEVGDYTFGHSSVVPATLFDHKNENGDKIPGTITSAGYQAFESMTNLPVVEMSNIASLNKTAFKNADTKAIIIPQDNLPQKQVESFFNSNKAILGIVYGEGEIDVPAKLGSDVKLGSEEGIKYLYNSETAGVPVTYQWSKDGKVLDTELSSEKEIAHFAAEDAGKYEKSVQLTLKDGEENDKNSELYHVGTYVLHEEAQAPTDPVMDADTLVDTSVAISGKTVAGAQVRLTDKDGKLTYNLATADETGKFTFSLAAPYEAGTKLYVQATNEVGSSAIVEADIVAGAQKPVANVPTKGDKVITGTGKAGNTITITNGIDTLGTGTVAEDGTFSVELGTPVTVGQKFKVYATTVPVDETHPLDENLMVTVTAVDSVGTITVDDYHTGDRTITGSYTGNIDSIRLVIGGKTISRGGTVKDGKFSYYCGDKIKAEQTVTLEGLDKNNQVLDSKEFKAINTSEGTLSDAHYKLGSNEITAAYTGDVAKICLRVNGEVVSWGGTLSEGHVSYYVKSNAIKANDKVTVQAYDQYSAPLGEEQVVQFEKSEGSLKTAVREAGSNVIKGTYEGDAAGAVLKVNGEIVSQGGSFANGTFSFYIGAMKFKEDDVITMEGLDEQQQALDSDPVTVEIQKGEATVSDLSYTLGATLITGTYEGVPVKAQLLVDGTSVSYGGTFKDGTLSYVVKADTITSKDQKVTMNIFDIDGNTVQKDLPVTVTADQK